MRGFVRALFLPAVILSVVTVAYPGAAATRAAGVLDVDALAFSAPTVNASAGGATVTLTWTVTDTNAAATTVAGDLDIQLAGSTAGTYVGPTYTVPYQYNTALANGASYVSGTPQDSTYSDTFTVPQYAPTATADWVVTQVTIQDDQSDTRTVDSAALATFDPVLTATESVDDTAPVFNSVSFYSASPNQSAPSTDRPYAYNNGALTVQYQLIISDDQSGVWQGTVTFAGPDGATVNAPIQAADAGALNVVYFADLAVPASSPTGVWTVSSVTATDYAGNTATYGDLDADPFTATKNDVISASALTLTPNPVDNSTSNQTVQLSYAVPAGQPAIQSVIVDNVPLGPSNIPSCQQESTTPVANADGTYSVPIEIYQGTEGCELTGIAFLDAAGDVAVYGDEYQAPASSLIITPTTSS